ncbi:hypothetical protein Pse7367_1472 [Thalassoporum mexicanum PCC 7367]|uniref:DUF3179 domain-containing protein n=1 Tax=Thalassoporum mexicanum TaxID=3457544 RepID=UPI00029F817A|nr:DUF3179 domain-containing protein [Pseudanabaena sp. PCC 7367]AFY69763.1 hypothetical protein Pse7367_1472 [Pseudanabaena sp. PCC 7367]
MKKGIKIAIAATLVFILTAGGLFVSANGLDDLKLRYYFLLQYLNDQDREIGDLEEQNINVAELSRIEIAQLLNGGPPKDGIPSVDNPEFDTATTTSYGDDHTVIGIVINGEAKAYPYGVMNWHEIVNDRLGGVNITVSYCPLCDTILAFERGESTFGVSGKLYQSCLVMFDRTDDTLYSQPWGMGIIGPQVNHNLKKIPAVKTTLGAWLEQHPDSLILSTDTGYNRNYTRYPYGSYYTNDQLIFPVRDQEARKLHPKEIVSYIWQANDETPHNQFAGHSHQFVHSEIKELGSKKVEFGDRTVTATWDQNLDTVIVRDEQGNMITSSTAFAFVYPAFFDNPDAAK